MGKEWNKRSTLNVPKVDIIWESFLIESVSEYFIAIPL